MIRGPPGVSMGWKTSQNLVGILAITALLQDAATSIRITKVEVPPAIEVGSQGDLDCAWDEGQDQMYSVKWYQGANEFYRYTPAAKDPIQIFDLVSLDVDRQKSWGGTVRIANVTLAAGGLFHCEVSADGPTFHTASDYATLNVVDLPDGAPVISGLRSSYLPKDWVDLTCTSSRSKPAPKVSFRINAELAAPEWLEPQVDTLDSAGLTTSSRRLRFYLLPELLQDGDARLQCVAEIPQIYRQVTEDLLSTRPPYQASVLDASAASGTRIGSWLQVTPILSALLLASAAHCLLL
ncbi:uncharacterized protein LOC122259185 [Penaeus japonicus]|uniref:uncharacterized protein LOC122259185 n=1 Tax=Penaeus japonicus TaxID=27405 RepID=UPI001C70D866|nr:uncharacterized protein LOC122259185 [Penaeus japonicus]